MYVLKFHSLYNVDIEFSRYDLALSQLNIFSPMSNVGCQMFKNTI